MYYCVKCGAKLREIGLGLRACVDCETQFLMTTDPEWEKTHPKQRMNNTCWMEDFE